MSDSTQVNAVVNNAVDQVQAKDGAWYTRTEFWGTLASMAMGGMMAAGVHPPVVQAIGATMSGLAPIVYTWGRSNVKVATAAGVMGTVGQVLSQPPPQ